MNIVIRNETASDIDAITEITKAAFETLAISRHTEQFIIKALREANALTISLVAEVDGNVVGHIAFSPVTVSDDSRDWYGIGPVSVLPSLQRRGIGTALMKKGLSMLAALDAKGCMLVGDPDYYERFGFRSPSALAVDDVPQQYFLLLPFSEEKPRGTVEFHQAFSATG